MYSDKDLQRIYDESYFKTRYPFPEMWVNRAKFLISKFAPRRTLDMGCSIGLLVKSLAELGVDAYGIEGSDYALAQVRPSIKNRVKKVNLECDRLPFDDSSFDLVTGFYVTEHIHAIDHFAAEVHRVLAKGGRAWFITPDGPRQGPGNEADVNINTYEGWKRIFERQGFRVEKFGSYYGFMTLRGRLGFLQLYRLPEPLQTWTKIAIYKLVNRFITKELSFVIVK